MLAVFAEFERDILRDRVKAGIAQAARKGGPTAHRRRSPTKLLKSGGSSRRA
jgi:DNA invertase Pin-like site-specific DNA recombinase